MQPSPELDRTEQNLAAGLQQLRQSEHRYRTLAEISQDMIFVINRQAEVEYVNPYAAGRLGAPSEAIIGRKIAELFPQQVVERQTSNLAKVMQSNQPMYVEAQTDFGEDRIWLGTWMIPYTDENGQVAAVMGVSRDITERKKAENELNQAKEYAEKLIQTANVIVVGLDLDGNIQVFNAAAEEITGYSWAEAVGKNWFELFVPRQIYPEVWEMFSRLSSGELPNKFENPIITKSGEERIISWQNSDVRQINGTLTGTISFGMDVTERRQAEQVQSALYRISEAAHAAQSLDELYSLIHDVICDLMPTRNFYIGLYDPFVELIHFPYHYDERDLEWPPHKLDKSLTSYVLRTGKAVLLTAVEMDTLEAAREVTPLGARPVDWLGVPLKSNDQTIGVMTVQSYDVSCRLTNQHKDVLMFMSDQVAMAIERKLAETALTESEARYRSLVEMSPDAIAVHQKGSLVFVNPAAVRIMGASRPEELIGRPISLVIHPDYRQMVLERVRESLRTGTPLPLIEEKFVRLDGSAVDVEVAAAPLMFHGEQVMQVIVRDITQRKEQEEKLRLASEGLAQAYDATLEGWSRALELREQETSGHSQRVVHLTLQLADALGIENGKLVHIRRGALLHDIGKMGVPDSILLKPGPLSEDEWVIMRQHPVFAYEMLKNIPYLAQALEIPYYHHERWDGSGYPQGLQENDIPLAARIFAVIDVYDALCSARPYRPAWPEDETRSYLVNNAGILFDPQVVERFLATII
jgi:PAS domain S-box-containing protein/putative nucleotidyltransferase with HDIG domain